MLIRMDILVRFQHSLLFYTFTHLEVPVTSIPLVFSSHSLSPTLCPFVDLIVGVFGADKAVLYRYSMLILHFEITRVFDRIL